MMKQNQQLLIDAIRAGDESQLVQLLDASGDIQAFLHQRISLERPTNHAIGHGMTPLQFASIRSWGEGHSAQVLLRYGAELDMHSACGLGKTDEVASFIERDPRSVEIELDSYVPIQFAITANQPSVIEVLSKHDADPNCDIRKVAYFGWEDEVRNPSSVAWKPIHMAALWCFNAERVPVLKALIDAGADPSLCSSLDGFGPLHLLAMGNRVDGIRFLVNSDVPVDGRSELRETIQTQAGEKGPISGVGCTPLMVAAAEGFLEATQCLLDLGADPTLTCEAGHTAMDYAKRAFWDGQPYEAVAAALQNSA